MKITAGLALSNLIGCDGEPVICEIPNANYSAPAINTLITVNGNSLPLEEICDQVLVTTISADGVHDRPGFGVANTDTASCFFSTSTRATDTARTDTPLQLVVQIPGYTTQTFDDAFNPPRGECSSTIEVIMQPSNLGCAQGYFDVGGQCVTRNGCSYPQLEEQIIDRVPFNMYFFQCVDTCLNGLDEKLGQCAPVREQELTDTES